MPSYLILANYTDQGIRTIKQSPQRVEAFKQAATAAGGKVVFVYLTMGQYDLALLAELPNDEVAARLALTVGAQGNVRTTTLKAFQETEFQRIIGSLP
ncbi:MAG: GYD domain-containing protein [Dehalococcoidia bacterium]|nr:GYD domain-containing protein [Dehalococcoidia bacterium]